jgi:hypothetical protein
LLAVQQVTGVRYNYRLICGSVFEFFPTPSVLAVILAKRSQNYPSMPQMSQGGFGVTELRFSASYPSHHLGYLLTFL